MWAGTLAHNDLAGLGRNAKPNGRAGGWESHALEHELSAHDPRITHGAGLAVIFPAWMRYVWRENPDRFLSFGRDVFGIEPVDPAEDNVDVTPEEAVADAVSATIDELQAFFVSLGMVAAPQFIRGTTSPHIQMMFAQHKFEELLAYLDTPLVRIGYPKWNRTFMVVGFVLLVVGVLTLCGITLETPVLLIAAVLSLVGFGIGLTFEILVLIVQNEFPASDVGMSIEKSLS